jgi:hypothetical protein
MKKLVAISFFLFSFVAVEAQTTTAVSESVIFKIKLPVSEVIVLKAPDSDDSGFIAVAVREELIRAEKIFFKKDGDTLFVKLLIQHKEEISKNSSYISGRDGKWGEMSLSVISKNGNAAATSTNYIGSNDGAVYYTNLKHLAKEVAEKFVFIY